ncbi:hypothetical protein Q9L42_001020 [Methylomarinum sp. Ch1-1]|uniref:Uncharacterized protein n=1 Tax=Methylomarinum roseum TaxID=3067653 RepID=A0AAU7NUT9_9GAMM
MDFFRKMAWVDQNECGKSWVSVEKKAFSVRHYIVNIILSAIGNVGADLAAQCE